MTRSAVPPLPRHVSHTAGVSPRARPSLRVRWSSARWWERALSIAGLVMMLPVVAFVGLFAVNVGRVAIGGAAPGPMASAWTSVDLDSVAAMAGVAADTLGPVPPILDSLAVQWSAQENAAYPHLILRATPLHGGDVAIALNPTFYQVVTPGDQAARVAEMQESWRFVLGTSGVQWPTDGSYPAPRVIVYRLESDGPPAQFAIVTFADSTLPTK